MILAAALFSSIAGENAHEAGSAKGGGTKLLQISGGSVLLKAEPASSKPMSCGKCTDELVKRVDLGARGANQPATLSFRHLCDGCGNEWSVVGHGKAKVSVATHKCTSCGEETGACCNTGNSSAVATRGMSKKFEVAPLK